MSNKSAQAAALSTACAAARADDPSRPPYRRLFADPVRPCWCITGPVGPLGSTNQNWLCVRLLPMAVSVYLVVCVHSCLLLGTRHYSLWPNGEPAFGLPTHTQHSLISVIRGVVKRLSQKPAVNNARQS